MAQERPAKPAGFAMAPPGTTPVVPAAPGGRADSPTQWSGYRPGNSAAAGSTGRSPDDTGDTAGEDGVERPLGDDDLVDLSAERAASDVDEVLTRLDRELVGLIPVKTRIREIASLLLVDRLRQRYDLGSSRPSLHMCFTGAPGTGKTTVAMRMAELLHRLGYLRRNTLVSVTRDDLVGQYIGHTAPKTREVLKRAMGGVLFIDEAYYLYRQENERDYGQETIEMLLQVMENERDDLVVILAGYKDRMETFFRSNPGMSSRVAHHIDFPDYTPEELLAIARLMLQQMQYQLSAPADEALREYIERRRVQPHFANARSIRNALDRARLRQASRLFERKGGVISRQELQTIEESDIRASRVLRGERP